MKIKTGFIIVLMIFAICALTADFSVHLNKSDINKLTPFEELKPGMPAVEVLPLKIAIPMGEKVNDIAVVLKGIENYENHTLRNVDSIVPTDGKNYQSIPANETVLQ